VFLVPWTGNKFVAPLSLTERGLIGNQDHDSRLRFSDCRHLPGIESRRWAMIRYQDVACLQQQNSETIGKTRI